MEKLIKKWYDIWTTRQITSEEQQELIKDLEETGIDFMDFAIEIKRIKQEKENKK